MFTSAGRAARACRAGGRRLRVITSQRLCVSRHRRQCDEALTRDQPDPRGARGTTGPSAGSRRPVIKGPRRGPIMEAGRRVTRVVGSMLQVSFLNLVVHKCACVCVCVCACAAELEGGMNHGLKGRSKMGKWEGGSRGKGRILKADSGCCMAEANTILQSSYPPIRNKFLKKYLTSLSRKPSCVTLYLLLQSQTKLPISISLCLNPSSGGEIRTPQGSPPCLCLTAPAVKRVLSGTGSTPDLLETPWVLGTWGSQL